MLPFEEHGARILEISIHLYLCSSVTCHTLAGRTNRPFPTAQHFLYPSHHVVLETTQVTIFFLDR